MDRLARLICLGLALGTLITAPAAAQPPAQSARNGPVRIFLDCSYFCDDAFLKREITYVDYMRDRRDADVHLLVTTQDTGGGGRSTLSNSSASAASPGSSRYSGTSRRARPPRTRSGRAWRS